MPRDASRAGEPPRHPDRAAQFMPFAALTGYYDLIREREREALRAWGDYGQRRDPGAAPSWPDEADDATPRETPPDA